MAGSVSQLASCVSFVIRSKPVDAKSRRPTAIDPRSARAHNGLGVIAMKTGRPDEAFAQWKRAVELSPNDFDALFNLSMELDAAGRHDEARPYLERFTREAPPAQYAPDIARARKLLQR